MLDTTLTNEVVVLLITIIGYVLFLIGARRRRPPAKDRDHNQMFEPVGTGTKSTDWLMVVSSAVLAIFTIELYRVASNQTAILTASDAALHRSADVADRMREITEANERAWVGPVNATISAPVEPDRAVKVNVIYANSGKQPAVLNTFSGYFVAKGDEWAGGLAYADVYAWASSCLVRKFSETDPIRVAYPSTAVSNYTLYLSSDEPEDPAKRFTVTGRFLSGNEVFVLTGCFVYKSFGTDRHSVFCFFYQHNLTDRDRLTYCRVGQYAE